MSSLRTSSGTETVTSCRTLTPPDVAGGFGKPGVDGLLAPVSGHWAIHDLPPLTPPRRGRNRFVVGPVPRLVPKQDPAPTAPAGILHADQLDPPTIGNDGQAIHH